MTSRICVLLVFIMSLALAPRDAGAQDVKLKANLQFPIGHPIFGASLARFKEEVERQSGNTVSIEIFDKSQLFKDHQVVDAVAAGSVDIAITAAQQFSYKAPLVGILDQPFLFNFPALMHAAARPDSEIRKLIDEAILTDVGVRVLWWHSVGNNVVFSNGRDVSDPERVRDQRVASPGKLPGEFVRWCGGRPAVMTVEKFSQSLKDGTVDMAVLSFAAIQSFWKVADTITVTAHTPVELFLVINEKTWQSLSPGQRAIMAEAAGKVERDLRDRLSQFDARDRALAVDKGIKVRELTPDQVAEWRACSAGMLAEFMEKHGERARKLMDAYGKLRLDPCCSAGPASTAAFTRR